MEMIVKNMVDGSWNCWNKNRNRKLKMEYLVVEIRLVQKPWPGVWIFMERDGAIFSFTVPSLSEIEIEQLNKYFKTCDAL